MTLQTAVAEAYRKSGILVMEPDINRLLQPEGNLINSYSPGMQRELFHAVVEEAKRLEIVCANMSSRLNDTRDKIQAMANEIIDVCSEYFNSGQLCEGEAKKIEERFGLVFPFLKKTYTAVITINVEVTGLEGVDGQEPDQYSIAQAVRENLPYGNELFAAYGDNVDVDINVSVESINEEES